MRTPQVGDKFIPNDIESCQNYKYQKQAHHIVITSIAEGGSWTYDIMDKDDNKLDSCFGCLKESNTTPLTTNKYSVGDIFVYNTDKDERMVLAVLPEKCDYDYCMSAWNNFYEIGVYRTEQDLDDDYTLKGSQEVEEAIKTLEKAGKLVDGKVIV